MPEAPVKETSLSSAGSSTLERIDPRTPKQATCPIPQCRTLGDASWRALGIANKKRSKVRGNARGRAAPEGTRRRYACGAGWSFQATPRRV